MQSAIHRGCSKSHLFQQVRRYVLQRLWKIIQSIGYKLLLLFTVICCISAKYIKWNKKNTTMVNWCISLCKMFSMDCYLVINVRMYTIFKWMKSRWVHLFFVKHASYLKQNRMKGFNWWINEGDYFSLLNPDNVNAS